MSVSSAYSPMIPYPISSIPQALLTEYQIQVTPVQRWSDDDLSSLLAGMELIQQAFAKLNLPPPATRDFFGNTQVCLVRKPSTIYYILKWGQASAVIPPVGILGWRGTTIHCLPNLSPALFIHELGHRLDFRLGSTYQRQTLEESTNPSTHLMHFTNSKYINTPQTCGRHRWLWGYCLATRGWRFKLNTRFNPVKESGYRAGLATSYYGLTDHFEDFAESWLAWVLDRAGHHPNRIFHPKRLEFFDEQLPRWWRQSLSKQ